jgi:hypothetical protein
MKNRPVGTGFFDADGRTDRYDGVLLSTTDKMQRYTIFFITVNALHVSAGFSAHHQEQNNCTYSIWYTSSLLAPPASGSSKQAWDVPDFVCKILELLMMGDETARNMYSIDSNKEYCITLHLVGCTWKNTIHTVAKFNTYVNFISLWFI